MSMKTLLLVVAGLVTISRAQIPGLGSCPQYVPMSDFSIAKYLGSWYEVERMFQVLETASRCISANYTQTPDGKIHVANHVTSRITGIKRILDGELKLVGKNNEGKMSVKYSVLPVNLPIETEYTVLDTDYDSYSVVWHCSNVLPFFNTQNAWIMTRERVPSGSVLQRAYGVLDKYNISRSTFTKTLQEDCDGKPTDTTPSTTTAGSRTTTTTAPQSREQVNIVEEGEPLLIPVQQDEPSQWAQNFN